MVAIDDPAGAAGTIIGTCIASILDTWGATMSECRVRIVSDCVEFEVTLLNGRRSGPIQVHTDDKESVIPNASVPASRLLDDLDWTRASAGALQLMREEFGRVWFENLSDASDAPIVIRGTLGSFYEEAVLLGMDEPPAD
jgi:hypothetical protein